MTLSTATFAFSQAFKPALFASALLISQLATASDKTQISTELATVLANMQTIKANFTQTTSVKTVRAGVKIGGQTTKKSEQVFKGIMQVKRPGLFRWETQSPMQQLIVSSKRYVWIYDEDLAQATRQKVDEQLTSTPAMLFSGNPKAILSVFKVSQPNANTYLLKAKSKDALFESFKLELDDSKHPKQLVLQDSLGQKTTVTFSEVKVNEPIDNSQFQFTPPKGVDVIDQ